jgi:copper homeostasis protein
MLLEVIATTAEEALTAEAAGADRIELITAMQEGGLTPSLGIIEETIDSVRIPVHVMVRPHSRSFVMSGQDLRTMVRDIRRIRRTGARALVLGVLNSDGTVQEEALQQLLEAAEGMAVTFHRAFDEVRDQEEALYTLAQYAQIRTILTSGGKLSALEAVHQIERLVKISEGTHIRILAGSGLTLERLESFIRSTGVQEVHFGSAVRTMGKVMNPVSPERVRQAKEILNLFNESGRGIDG